MNDLASSLKVAYPDSIEDTDWRLKTNDDGSIAIWYWNAAKLGTQPIEADLIAAQASAVTTAARQALVDQAHDAAVAYVNDFGDAYAFTQLVAWLYDPSISDATKTMINDVNTWKNAVMAKYLGVLKPALLNGDTPAIDYSSCGQKPHSFTDIATSAAGG